MREGGEGCGRGNLSSASGDLHWSRGETIEIEMVSFPRVINEAEEDEKSILTRKPLPELHHRSPA